MAFPDPIAGTLLPARELCELEVAFRGGFYCALLRSSFPRKAPYELWARGHEVLGNSPLWVWTVPPGGCLSPSGPPSLTYTAAPRWVQHEARPAGAQVAAPGVHALRVLAQPQGQALIDICRGGGMSECPFSRSQGAGRELPSHSQSGISLCALVFSLAKHGS